MHSCKADGVAAVVCYNESQVLGKQSVFLQPSLTPKGYHHDAHFYQS